MESNNVPQAWIGQRVRIELRDARTPKEGLAPGKAFDTRAGMLQAVSELGVVLEEPTGETNLIRFYPWSAIRGLSLQ